MKKLLLKSWENEKKFDERDSTREDLRVIKRERDGEKKEILHEHNKDIVKKIIYMNFHTKSL